jgi:hypothetical protein
MPGLNEHRHLIIAGTNKSGTTSVFRYLGDHPGVLLSKFKESGFFLTPLEERPGNVLDTYRTEFIGEKSSPRLFVEATPQYLHCGAAVAPRIASVLPDARILFLLRNPADRIISYYRSSYGQDDLPTYGIDFDQFVDEAISAMQVDEQNVAELPYRQRAFRQEIRISRYVDFLPYYTDAFGAQNVCVSFFDSLTSDPRQLMKNVCEFIGIESAVYDEFNFRVENRTRLHRSAMLRKVSGTLNAQLEPLLNWLPSLRRAARGVYDFVNVQRDSDSLISESGRQKLEDFCAPWNAELSDWLTTNYPNQPLPPWQIKSNN